MEYVEFYKHFPRLIPESLNPLKADGYMEIANGDQVQITIDAEAAGGIYKVDVVKTTPRVEQFLQDKEDMLNTRFKQCTTGLSFAKELQHSLSDLPRGTKVPESKYYSRIFKECEDAVGWDNVVSFDKTAQMMVLTFRDPADRAHEVYVNFENETLASSMEEGVVLMEGAKLEQYLAALKGKCQQMSACWSQLDDVDASLCVLQPQRPKRHELWRRVAVGDLATALIEVSPSRNYPKIIVYGPSSIAEPLNARAKDTRSVWTSARSARKNLEAVLGCELPQQSSFDQSNIKLECGICFAFKGDGEVADQLCASDQCAQPFHRKCLVQWLTSKEDTRRSFTTLFGKCPYCSGNVSVSSI